MRRKGLILLMIIVSWLVYIYLLHEDGHFLIEIFVEMVIQSSDVQELTTLEPIMIKLACGYGLVELRLRS